MSCFRAVRYIVAILVVLSLGMFVAEGVLDYWWATKTIGETSQGLWRTCNSIFGCRNRKDLMEFEEKGGFNLDLIILALAVGALGTLIHLIFILRTMCQGKPSKTSIFIGSLFLFLGVGGGIFGLVWALLKVSDANQSYAMFCLYGADGLGLISLVLSLVLLCVRAPRSGFNDDEIAMLQR